MSSKDLIIFLEQLSKTIDSEVLDPREYPSTAIKMIQNKIQSLKQPA